MIRIWEPMPILDVHGGSCVEAHLVRPQGFWRFKERTLFLQNPFGLGLARSV